MKKLAISIIMMSLTLFSGKLEAAPAGGAAASGASTGSSFAWGIGLVGLAVVSTVVGLAVSSSASSGTTFSHS